MNKEQVNELLKNRIGFTQDEELDSYRETYSSIVNNASEEDFYYSMRSWWDDGNAPYYDNWLRKNWR